MSIFSGLSSEDIRRITESQRGPLPKPLLWRQIPLAPLQGPGMSGRTCVYRMFLGWFWDKKINKSALSYHIPKFWTCPNFNRRLWENSPSDHQSMVRLGSPGNILRDWRHKHICSLMPYQVDQNSRGITCLWPGLRIGSNRSTIQWFIIVSSKSTVSHGSLNVPIEHHPTIRFH